MASRKPTIVIAGRGKIARHIQRYFSRRDYKCFFFESLKGRHLHLETDLVLLNASGPSREDLEADTTAQVLRWIEHVGKIDEFLQLQKRPFMLLHLSSVHASSPTDIYGIMHACIENLLEFWLASVNRRIEGSLCIARLCNVFGLGHQSNSRGLIDFLASSSNLNIINMNVKKPSDERDFIDINYVLRVLEILIAEKSKSAKKITIGSGKVISIGALLNCLRTDCAPVYKAIEANEYSNFRGEIFLHSAKLYPELQAVDPVDFINNS